MKHLMTLLAALVVALACIPAARAADVDPVANSSATVIAGNARFTVLTPRLIRMEWAADGQFEDRATLGFVNRRLPVPAFTKTVSGNKTIIKTSDVTLTYTGKGKFSADNLTVSFQMNGRTVTWHPGMEDKGNLLGTFRTLDGVGGPVEREKYEPGVISRDGWVVIDESTRQVLTKDDSDWGEWVENRTDVDRLDLYMFAYGHNYIEAVSDFTKVAGRIPLPPKYVFGYWYSRYWRYTDLEFLEMCNTMREQNIPIDVMVIDMDWHETWDELRSRSRNDEAGQRTGWTGYTWNKDLFPDPVGFLREVHDLGFKTSLNLHPASGIPVYEEPYERFVQDYLSRTENYDGPKNYVYAEGDKKPDGTDAKAGYRAGVQYRMDQQAWADAYFNSVIHPLEEQGVDFWWLDWQQFMQSRYVDGLSNTFWINYTFFNDKVRRGADNIYADRPMIYHRWGGLGSHRYQIGFSGDTYDEWPMLAYEPFFTATASNVGYGYWGHDIGGHMQHQKHLTDPEMYTRWLQYGVFSPIFKTHATNSDIIERRIWTFPTHFEYMRDAIRLRYTLSPYIYDAARQAYDSGISICRPLYYYYPEEENAYTWTEEFMFGDNILATAVCQPADSLSGLADRQMWFPKGSGWYDMAKHEMIRGGQILTRQYTIDENPWFVKAGAIIPMADESIRNLQDPSNVLRIFIAPGRGLSSYVHYEDDGVSQAYVQECATTLIRKQTDQHGIRVDIMAREGSYKGMDPERKLSVIFGGVRKQPSGVFAGGRPVEFSYNEQTLEVEVSLPQMSASQDVRVAMRF